LSAKARTDYLTQILNVFSSAKKCKHVLNFDITSLHNFYPHIKFFFGQVYAGLLTHLSQNISSVYAQLYLNCFSKDVNLKTMRLFFCNLILKTAPMLNLIYSLLLETDSVHKLLYAKTLINFADLLVVHRIRIFILI